MREEKRAADRTGGVRKEGLNTDPGTGLQQADRSADDGMAWPKFPVFVDLSNRKILVYGGGAIAQRRIQTLLGFGPQILVVSPELTEELAKMVSDGRIRWKKRVYRAGEIRSGNPAEGCFFILAAVKDPVINRQIADEARLAGIPVNDASCQDDSDFFFPAIMQKDSLILGMTSDGSDHRRVRRAAQAVREFLKNTDL